MKVLYCWRCRCEIPMLDEAEYALFHNETFFRPSRLAKGKSPEEVRDLFLEGRRRGLEVYFMLTGFRETNANAVHHHRLKLYGPPCGWCEKPLRTPKAKFCAACGTPITSPLAKE